MSRTYERFAAVCAVLAGAAGFLYSLSFIVIARSSPNLGGLLSGLFLMLGGPLAMAALIALYYQLRENEAQFSLLALVLGLLGSAGATLQGGYDLANAINPPGILPAGVANLPSPVDPRGLLAFGVTGLAVLAFSWLMGRSERFPRGLSYLGFLSAALLVLLYLGRLVVLDATSLLIVGPALLAGFIVNPAWYVWLGLALWRPRRSAAERLRRVA